MIRLLRRIANGVRWRVRRALRPRSRTGRAVVGGRRFEHLVVHAPVPPGYTTPIGAALIASARHLSKRGIVVLTPAELREIGRLGWSGVTPSGNARVFAAGLRDAVSQRRITGQPRAVIVSTGRALGRERLGADESRRLRPDAAATLTELTAAIPARRITVVIEVPDSAGLRDEMLAAAVEEGRTAPQPPSPVPGLHEELARRVGRVRRVRRVVTLVGDDAQPERFATAVGAVVGPIELAAADSTLVTPRWNLRSMLAAAAVNSETSGRERQMAHSLLRNRLARPPMRAPRAIVPRAVGGAEFHVAPGPEPLNLHLHIGLQKTATTTIQAALHQGRSRLAEQGVAYVGRRFMMRIQDHQAWRAYPHTGKTSLARFAADLHRTVWEHRTSGGGPHSTVLISNEALVGAMEKGPFLERPFRPRAEAAISDILDILEPDTCHLVLVTRRQDTLLESQYMWQIHGGGAFTFERYLASFRAHPDALSYLGLGERLERIPGITGVTMHPFEAIRGGLDRFLNALIAGTGATLDLTVLTFDPESNPSYSGRALEIALAVNPHLRGRKEHRVVRDHLRTAFPASQWGRVVLLDDATRAAILDGLVAENEAVFRRWMPAYPEKTYSTAAGVPVPPQALSNSPGTGK
jgi:hypothetical protein